MPNATDTIRVQGQLPSDQASFSFTVARGVVVLRAGDRVCLAHPRWLTVAQARLVAAELMHVTEDQ